MEFKEFIVGEIFWCGGRRWRCTDKGNRTVIAIRLDDVEVVEWQVGTPKVHKVLTYEEANASGWFNGPPYRVAEHVFDEYDIEGCLLTPEEL